MEIFDKEKSSTWVIINSKILFIFCLTKIIINLIINCLKPKTMQKNYYKSLLGQVAYVLISGIQLLFIPNFLLKTFGLEPTSEIWIRVLGMLVLALSFYYYAMYKNGGKEIIRATVQGRLFFCAGLMMFVIFGMAKPVLIVFAAVETGLALWTLSEIRQGAKE